MRPKLDMSRPGYLAVVNVVKDFESATPVSAMQDMIADQSPRLPVDPWS